MNIASARGMEVEVIQQLQRQGAYRKDKIFSQQIELRLNSAMNNIIKSKIRPNPQFPLRFEIDQKSVTDIQAIIVPNKELRIIKQNEVRGYVQLPNDFNYLVNDRSNVIEDCKEAFSNATESYPYQVRVFNFNDTGKTASPYYQQVGVTKGTTLKTVPVVTGLPSKKDKDILVKAVIDVFKQHGYDAYWETFGDLYRPSAFLVVVENLGDNITFQLDGSTQAAAEIISKTVTRYKSLEGEEVPNRCYQQDFIYNAVLTSNYMKPSPDSPVSSIAQNQIFVHTSKKFLVSKILIDYIRQPRPISLYLNTSCELHPSTHQEVCDVAVELLKRDIEDNTYPSKVQENIQRNQN